MRRISNAWSYKSLQKQSHTREKHAIWTDFHVRNSVSPAFVLLLFRAALRIYIVDKKNICARILFFITTRACRHEVCNKKWLFQIANEIARATTSMTWRKIQWTQLHEFLVKCSFLSLARAYPFEATHNKLLFVIVYARRYPIGRENEACYARKILRVARLQLKLSRRSLREPFSLVRTHLFSKPWLLARRGGDKHYASPITSTDVEHIPRI